MLCSMGAIYNNARHTRMYIHSEARRAYRNARTYACVRGRVTGWREKWTGGGRGGGEGEGGNA